MLKVALAVLVVMVVAVAGDLAPTGFVYLGHCDPSSGWKDDATFENLPACNGKAAEEHVVVAKKGMKVRDRLPAGESFGAEIGRIKQGQKVKLKSPVVSVGNNIIWGEVLFPAAAVR